ncbi:hypothetical protein JAAARDRAFT_198483 [Jaapia argillacea MUCL 33604]|uniref:Uncharacterized protein n=1 Tax=Jaapia argillacea MUCL 33604 TaxID=933084 RepID=A0A067PBM4_9AGAM|nr:hypothetical protein JAAARDRAFT_198483 [Jaapia argillacea MUCL 33604]
MTLESLRILPYDDSYLRPYPVEDLSPLLLPHLRSYAGRGELVPSLVPGSIVSTVTMRLYGPEGRGEEIAAALARSCGPIETVIISGFESGLAVVESISTELKGLRSLHIVDGIMAEVEDDDARKEYFDTWEVILPRFKDLTTLAVRSCYLGTTDAGSLATPTSEFERVCIWADLCPTLTCISLSTTAKWHRFPTPIWMPIKTQEFIQISVSFSLQILNGVSPQFESLSPIPLVNIHPRIDEYVWSHKATVTDALRLAMDAADKEESEEGGEDGQGQAVRNLKRTMRFLENIMEGIR